MRPRALDLFCNAGGATKGLQRAGFHVTGVDIRPQPRYCGDIFIQADALNFPLCGFDFIWASPPCQAFTILQNTISKEHPDLIPETRERLRLSGAIYTIENVDRAPLMNPFLLCGTMFGLEHNGSQLWRHRCFETNFSMGLVPPCQHRRTREIAGQRFGAITVTGHAGGIRRRGNLRQYTADERRAAMGIDWMTNEELSEAIPPAYAEFIGKQALQYLLTDDGARDVTARVPEGAIPGVGCTARAERF